MVSTLRCGRNNPGSNPGLGKYFILYSVMPLINLHTTRTMRGSKETYCFPLFHAGITIGDIHILFPFWCKNGGSQSDLRKFLCFVM